MRSPAAGTALFVLVGPLLECVVGPYLLTGWDAQHVPWPAVASGVGLVVGGGAVLAWALWQFVVEGRGTPSPAAPPVRLVRGGPYRLLHHPQYAATTAVIAGQGLLLGRGILLVAAAVYAVTTFALARFVEEPALARRHG